MNYLNILKLMSTVTALSSFQFCFFFLLYFIIDAKVVCLRCLASFAHNDVRHATTMIERVLHEYFVHTRVS